jgi:hypothetical protein
MRALMLAALLVAVLAAPADAHLTRAPFAAAGDSEAGCLRTTGALGELALGLDALRDLARARWLRLSTEPLDRDNQPPSVIVRIR